MSLILNPNLTEKVLYENSSGSNTAINLNDNPFKYKKIRVFAGWYADNWFPYGLSSHELDLNMGDLINISYNLVGSGWGVFCYDRWKFTTTQLKPDTLWRYNSNTNSYMADTNTRIVKVIGYA